METGRVKWFNPLKGYGFILKEDEDKDIFVHKTGIPFGVQINNGDKVEFEIGNGPKGPVAQNIKVLEGLAAY